MPIYFSTINHTSGVFWSNDIVMILYLHETRLIYFVILSVPRRWNVVNTKALILAIYRVTFQIVKWNVADIYFPKMSLIAALQIVS